MIMNSYKYNKKETVVFNKATLFEAFFITAMRDFHLYQQFHCQGQNSQNYHRFDCKIEEP